MAFFKRLGGIGYRRLLRSSDPRVSVKLDVFYAGFFLL